MSYFVGIDIAKYKHDCTILTEDGNVVNTFSFPNNEEGYETLKEALDLLNHSQKIKIGLEATGHYTRNLTKFLASIGHKYFLLNPYLVKRFATAITLRKTKTDRIDSKIIASYLVSYTSKPKQSISYNIEELKSLTRMRDKMVRQRSDQLVIITNSLDKIFPEFKQFFDNILGECALTILEKYTTPKQIGKLTSVQIEKLHNVSRTISVNKLTRLKDLANSTVGHHSEAEELIIKLAIQTFRVINKNIKDTEEKIKNIMKKINSPITSIPGIGINSAASLIAEYGNFENFQTPNQLLAYAGLECSKYQSGQADFDGKMVKRGSSHLRYVLMNIAVSVKNYCPTFSSFYLKKRDEGKHYRVALNHVVKKLLRVIFKLVSNNENYDINLSK